MHLLIGFSNRSNKIALNLCAFFFFVDRCYQQPKQIEPPIELQWFYFFFFLSEICRLFNILFKTNKKIAFTNDWLPSKDSATEHRQNSEFRLPNFRIFRNKRKILTHNYLRKYRIRIEWQHAINFAADMYVASQCRASFY